jgi:chromosome segregation ATPase
MNRPVFKNLLIVFLLAIAAFSVYKYSLSLKEKFDLTQSLDQAKTEAVDLVQQKQNLLQSLEKEKQSGQQLMQNNSQLKDYLKVADEHIAELLAQYKKQEDSLNNLESKFSILKAEVAALVEKKDEIFRENESLKTKLGSVEELKKAINELRFSERHKVSLRQQEAPEDRKEETGKVMEGNRGYLIKDGGFTATSRFKIEVVPTPLKTDFPDQTFPQN